VIIARMVVPSVIKCKRPLPLEEGDAWSARVFTMLSSGWELV
jgi:hypothetical protein